MNPSENASPSGSIALDNHSRGYMCIKRCAWLFLVRIRAFGRSCITHLEFIPKSKRKEASLNGFFFVKQYPDCRLVSFSDARSSEDVYLGYAHWACLRSSMKVMTNRSYIPLQSLVSIQICSTDADVATSYSLHSSPSTASISLPSPAPAVTSARAIGG